MDDDFDEMDDRPKPPPEVDDRPKPPTPPEEPAPSPQKSVFSPPEFISNAIPDMQDVAASTIEATTNAAENVKSFSQTNTGMTVVILVLGVVTAFVVAYAIYWFVNKTLNDRARYMLQASKMPIVCTKISTLTDDDKIPGAGNGKRMTISFWVYIYDINKYQGANRHIFHRGKEEDKEDVASPYVVLDANTNKIHVTFAPENSDDLLKYNGTNYAAPSSGNTVANAIYIIDAEEKKRAYRLLRGITIDYVPVQRWVHVAVVVNEEVNGGIITAYIDGEIVKNVTSFGSTSGSSALPSENIKGVKTTSAVAVTSLSPSSLPAGASSADVRIGLNINKADISRKGKIYVGGSPGSAIGPGFSGMVTKITFFNFDLNARDVYDEYIQGPIDNLLAKMGLPAYGLQSPIYRIA